MAKFAAVMLAIFCAFLLGAHHMATGAQHYYHSHYGQYGYSNSSYGYNHYSDKSHYSYKK